jgi:hypothetical protein
MMTTDQESRNSQLFEEVWGKALANIEKLTQDPAEALFFKSLVMGGTVAAETVVGGCAGIQTYWGEGTAERAMEISRLFSFLMLSQCYRWLDDKPSPEALARMPKEVISTQLIYIFEGQPEQGVDDFVRFDAQFNYDLSKHPHLVHLSGLTLARISDICGHPCLDWEQIKFPVAEFTHIMKKGILIDGAPMRSQDDINVVVKALSAGVEAMTRFHDGV